MDRPMTMAADVLRTIQPTPWVNRVSSAMPSGTAHRARWVALFVVQPAGTAVVRSARMNATTTASSVATTTPTTPTTTLARATRQRCGVRRKLVAGMPNRYSVVTVMAACTMTTIPMVMETVETTVRGV